MNRQKLIGFLVLFFIFGTTSTSAGTDTSSPTKVTGVPQKTRDGLQYWDIVVGTGPAAVTGKRVKVHYTGWLANGRKFDSSVDRGKPFVFLLGAGDVIKGWDEGVAGMKVGGKRQLRVPEDLGYGPRGAPGAIPPYATLIFDVELLAVGK
jgi:FKBP-type peptidyl-prolyl cis-trans isomerase FkpA